MLVRLFGILKILLLVSVFAQDTAAQSTSRDLVQMNNQALNLFRNAKYKEAIKLAERTVALAAERHGTEDIRYGALISNLAQMYSTLGRNKPAERLLLKSIAIVEKWNGIDSPQLASPLVNLAGVYKDQARHRESVGMLERAERITRKLTGEKRTVYARVLNNLAEGYRALNQFGEAEKAYKKALETRQELLGHNHQDVATVLANIAELYRSKAEHRRAEPLYERALAIQMRTIGDKHPETAVTLAMMAELYRAQGRYPEAASLIKRSLDIVERVYGSKHVDTATLYNNLASTYSAQGRYDEAERLHRKALAVRRELLGPDHPSVAVSLGNLASELDRQGKYGAAEKLILQSLSINEKVFGSQDARLSIGLSNLGGVYRATRRYQEAKDAYNRALEITKRTFGPSHRRVGDILNNLAVVYERLGNYQKSNQLYEASLKIRQTVLGNDHPTVAASQNNLALVAVQQNDWQRAANFWRAGTAIIKDRARRGLDSEADDQSTREATRWRWMFSGLIKVLNTLPDQTDANRAARERESFELAQWGQDSAAAAALTKLSARAAAGSPALSAIVREQQDLKGELQSTETTLYLEKSKPEQQRLQQVERRLADRIRAIEKRLFEIAEKLQKEFPGYSNLTGFEAISVENIQALLRKDEAFVLTLDTNKHLAPHLPAETFVWVVTKDDFRQLRSDLGTAALAREVGALRCGLDETSWYGDDALKCAELLNIAFDRLPAPGELPPFDLDRSYRLFANIFAGAEDLIAGKHLLVAASGALQLLPFQVLITEHPTIHTTYREAKWLGVENSITVLASASSLVDLRTHAKASQAARPYIGVGNPLLSGRDGKDRSAWRHQDCRQIGLADRAKLKRLAFAAPLSSRKAVRSRLAKVDDVRRQMPLPETAEELCSVARAQGIRNPDDAVLLGANATEGAIKALSAKGELAQVRVLHFATHGLLASETAALASARNEPALMLTPPAIASAKDDGLLTASEIAELKLDADLIILSACNTASGNGSSGSALAGLARAFIYAGGRSLLVSHWYVDSLATVQLITGIFDDIRKANVGPAEAMRKSMARLIATGGENSHPSRWAPFVVVGEGRSRS